MATVTNEEVAGRVRGIVAENRLTYTALAEQLHMSPMAFSRRVNGKTPFTPHELSVIADRAGVPVSALFGVRA